MLITSLLLSVIIGAQVITEQSKTIKCNYITAAAVGFLSIGAMLFLSEPIVSIFSKRKKALLFKLSFGMLWLLEFDGIRLNIAVTTVLAAILTAIFCRLEGEKNARVKRVESQQAHRRVKKSNENINEYLQKRKQSREGSAFYL